MLLGRQKETVTPSEVRRRAKKANETGNGRVHGEHEHRRKEHLEEQAPGNRDARREERANVERSCDAAASSISPARKENVLLEGGRGEVHSPGRSACTSAAPVMPPRICEMVRSPARRGVRAPTRSMPSETAGLKRPPDTRKLHVLGHE